MVWGKDQDHILDTKKAIENTLKIGPFLKIQDFVKGPRLWSRSFPNHFFFWYLNISELFVCYLLLPRVTLLTHVEHIVYASYIKYSNMTTCAETSFEFYAHTIISQQSHCPSILRSYFFTNFIMSNFIVWSSVRFYYILFYSDILWWFIYFCTYSVSNKSYNGWNSRLLRSPQYKQIYVKQFIPCKN